MDWDGAGKGCYDTKVIWRLVIEKPSEFENLGGFSNGKITI